MIAVDMKLMSSGPSIIYISSRWDGNLLLVDWITWHSFCSWPLDASILGGICLVTNVSSIPGKVAMQPFLTALRRAYFVGFPSEL